MKAQELRIGNYLELLGEIRKVEGIFNLPKRKEMYWIKCEGIIDTKIIHCEPIPLTEEWLFKLGGVKTTDSFGGYLFYYPNCNAMRIKNNEWSSQHITVKVEFVHQLQNLYFALTGEELTLKE